eukprot:COSAG01_NODE_1953_length_8818_cov_5.158619_6_plen_64_part_00
MTLTRALFHCDKMCCITVSFSGRNAPSSAVQVTSCKGAVTKQWVMNLKRHTQSNVTRLIKKFV